MQFSVNGTVRTGEDSFDHGISDLQILQSGSETTVLASSGPYGGLVSYDVDGPGLATVVDTAVYSPAWATGISSGLVLADDGSGGTRAIFGATGATRLGAFAVDASGQIGAVAHLAGLAPGDGPPEAMLAGSDGDLVLTGEGGGFSVYEQTGGNLSARTHVDDDDMALVESVSALAELRVAGNRVLIAASDTENGITAYRMGADGPVLAGRSGAEEGVGIMRPTDLATARVDGASYVIVGSAMDANGALSVLQVGADGTLTATDHVLDTRDTRFGAVQSVETVELDGVTYVIAGGGDDGLTLFTLLPGGQLQLLDTIEDSGATGLQNISAIAAAAVGAQIRILAASQAEAGLTDLTIDASRQGRQIHAGSGGETVTGAAGDDILVGDEGNDRINGGTGDDILVDGGGRDVLTGGAGRDLFVLRDDGTNDVITDFDPAMDQLDLSSWPMFHDPDSLEITSTATGAEIVWRGERLTVRSADGRPIDADSLRAAVVRGVNRPLDLSGFDFPDDRGYDIIGTDGDDVLRAGDGNQVIAGGFGNDTIWAGDGDDTILGGYGRNQIHLEAGSDIYRDENLSDPNDGDTVFGGAGNDEIITGQGNDTIDGGDDNDTIRAGGGDDTVTGGRGADTVWLEAGDDRYTDSDESGPGGADRVYGGDGRDWIDGGGGDDVLFGGNQDDTLRGGEGDDHLEGESGDDILRGGTGSDRLAGGDGNDTLIGNAGTDILRGAAGNDILRGGTGDDRLVGGAGNDRLAGGGGSDVLIGNRGDDTLRGRSGDDVLRGGGGSDRLVGALGDDALFGGARNDRLIGNAGNDSLQGQRGGDVLQGGAGADALSGGAGRDRLFGGRGNDVIEGGAGNDRLLGGSGADQFVFSAAGSGDDRILDFNPAVDRLLINGVTEADLSVSAIGSGLLISWADGSLTLDGVDWNDFSMSWIELG